MNCMNCHRLHTHGNTIFCPFFDMQPCINGEHYIKELPPEPQPQKPPKVEKKKSNYYDITPEFIPMEGKTNIDWESIHESIFKMKRLRYSQARIAEVVGVHPSTLTMYLLRYDPRSHLYKGKRR